MPNHSAEMFDFVLIALQHIVHDIWAPSHRPIKGPTGSKVAVHPLSPFRIDPWAMAKVWSLQGLALTLCCQRQGAESLIESRCLDTRAVVLFSFSRNPTIFPGVSCWSVHAREPRYMCHKCSSWYRKSVKHWRWECLYRWWNLPLSLDSSLA